MADSTPKSYSADPQLYLYTSLTAGSSHIITATSRLETILKANRIPFRALDVATDEKARMLWGRRSKGRKLPGLVKFGSVIGDLDEIEEWNEYGELKQQIGATSADDGMSAMFSTPPKPPAITPAPTSREHSQSRHISISEPRDSHDAGPANALKKDDTPLTMAMRQAGAEAAQKAGQKKTTNAVPLQKAEPSETETTAPLTETKLGKGAEDPESATEITAGKTPAQLASEGAKRTSVDKIADTKSNTGEDAAPPATLSNEEQMLQVRRTSSIAKQPSRLATETVVEENGTESTDAVNEQFERPEQMHRGSSISLASKEEIAAIEEADKIPEEEEEAVETSARPAESEVGASDEMEKLATGDKNPQEQESKDGEAAGASVGD